MSWEKSGRRDFKILQLFVAVEEWSNFILPRYYALLLGIYITGLFVSKKEIFIAGKVPVNGAVRGFS